MNLGRKPFPGADGGAVKAYIDYISEISAVLTQMADGDFSFALQHDYAGEFSSIKEGLLNTRGRVSDALNPLRRLRTVSSGAEQIAISAQSQAREPPSRLPASSSWLP